MLVNGQWMKKWDPFQKAGEKGEFIRQTSSFRHWVTPDGSAGKTGDSGFQAKPGRYHLYLALICPWASRVLMTLKLKGLEHIISVSIVEPTLTDFGWQFNHDGSGTPGATTDPINNFHYMHEVYTHADRTVSGRATVPALWDKQSNTIVNNESADIIEMLNSAFNEWAENDINLRPEAHLEEMLSLNAELYDTINNAVYRTGFAQSQRAYEDAVTTLFNGMDKMEARLSERKYLLGNEFTETDIRLFVTLVRFDLAYYGQFKCNIKACADYPALSRYIKDIYAMPNIASTVNSNHIKRGYYSVEALNPTGIVPVGPTLDWLENTL